MENQLEEAQELAQTSNHKVKMSQISRTFLAEKVDHFAYFIEIVWGGGETLPHGSKRTWESSGTRWWLWKVSFWLDVAICKQPKFFGQDNPFSSSANSLESEIKSATEKLRDMEVQVSHLSIFCASVFPLPTK